MNERDTKLIQWLNEAHAKESELEADLTAHIALTKKQPYKKRLREHLKETRDHKRSVARRVKELGGSPSTAKDRLGVPKAVGEAAVNLRLHAVVVGEPTGDPSQERPGGASRGARRNSDLHETRSSGGGSRRRRHGQTCSSHSPRRGAHGEVPRRGTEAARAGARQGGDPARPAPLAAAPDTFEGKDALTWQQPKRVAIEHRQLVVNGALPCRFPVAGWKAPR